MDRIKNSYSILVVEDDDKIARILMMYLGLYSKFTHVVHASDGVQAMLKLGNQEFDLVITDLSMPKRDGLDFIDTLRKIPKYASQKVIVISGCLTQEKTQECIKRSVRHIIVKPFTARQILFKTIGLLRAEEFPRTAVDQILEKTAKRFLERNNDSQMAILSEPQDEFGNVLETLIDFEDDK